jgi:hypothetical protein
MSGITSSPLFLRSVRMMKQQALTPVPSSPQSSNIGPPDTKLRDHRNYDITCSICMDNIKNIILLPCRHEATCTKCAHHLLNNNKKCPICRTVINNTFKYFKV